VFSSLASGPRCTTWGGISGCTAGR
jgi:hypothetical protein